MRHDAEAGHGSRNKTDRVGAGLVDILCLDGLLFGMRLRTNVRTRLVGGIWIILSLVAAISSYMIIPLQQSPNFERP